jgi:hypothetical protein
MLLIVSCSVLQSIFRALCLDNSVIDFFDAHMQMSFDTHKDPDHIIISVVHYAKDVDNNNELSIFSRIKISVEEFDNVKDDFFNIHIEKEILKKLLLTSKYYPQKYLSLSVDFDVLSASLIDGINSSIHSSNNHSLALTFTRQINIEDHIHEPDLLKHTCEANTDSFRKLLEFCSVQEKTLSISLTVDGLLKVQNEFGIYGSIMVSMSKKIKVDITFMLNSDFIPFLINRLYSFKEKNCKLFIGSKMPFVVEEAETGNRVYVVWFYDT